jgi:hypothetical protein
MSQHKKQGGPEDLIGFAIETYGVQIGFIASDTTLLEQIRELVFRILPNGFDPIEIDDVDHVFKFRTVGDGKCEFEICLKDQDPILAGEAGSLTTDDALGIFYNQLHLTIGGYAKTHVFLHAGVVAWREKAIILPGRGSTGKTTLVQELLKLGAVYYSDEYAPINDEGLVQPFAKMLSVRGIVDDYTQTEVAAESLGADTGTEDIPVGAVIFTEYEDGAKWEPETLVSGSAVMALVSQAITMRSDPGRSMNVLNRVAGTATIIKTKRSDAVAAAVKIITILEKSLD